MKAITAAIGAAAGERTRHPTVAPTSAKAGIIKMAGRAASSGGTPPNPSARRISRINAGVTKDQPYAEVESVKAVSDVIAPLSGEVTEVNEGLSASPENVNDDPYGEGWMVRIRLTDPSEADDLMDADAYEESLS